MWPGKGKNSIATADIGRVKNGALADYQVELRENLLESVGAIAHVRNYPRWFASVWDLVSRCIVAALNGAKEELPTRPITPAVPVHVRKSDGMRYVRFDEIPEPARTFFGHNLDGSSIPAHDCAYEHDWKDFLNGYR